MRLVGLALSKIVIASFIALLAGAASAGVFWQDAWEAPSAYSGPSFSFEPLTESHANAFFAAYEDEPDQLRERLGWGWPPVLADEDRNAELVRYHQSQHQQQQAFTYIVTTRDQRDVKRLVGAVYMVPVLEERDGVPGLMAEHFDVEVSWWLNTQALQLEQADDFVPNLFAWIDQSDLWQRVLLPVSVHHEAAIEALEAAALKPIAEDQDEQVIFYQQRFTQ